MMNTSPVAVALLMLVLAGCASTPEPCTREWAEYRTGIVLARFAGENRGLVNDIRDVVRPDGSLDPVRAALLAARPEALRRLAGSFERTLVPELRQVVAQCGRDDILVPAFTDFLRREGVPEKALDWIDPFLELTRTGQRDDGPRALAAR